MTVVPILLTVSGSVQRGKEEEVKRMLEDTLHDEVMADFKPFFQKVLVREFKLKEKPQLRRAAAAAANSPSQWKESAGEFTYKLKYELQIVDGELPGVANAARKSAHGELPGVANAAKVLETEINYRGIVLSNLDVWRDETLFPEPPVVTLRIAKASSSAAAESKTGSPKPRRQNTTRRRKQSRSLSPRSSSSTSWFWKLFGSR